MMKPPFFLIARCGKSLSTTSKTNFEISGILLRSGRIFAPAGMIWSVVILSPTFRMISPVNVAGNGGNSGKGAIFGPRMISMFDAFSGLRGTIIIFLFVLNVFGAVKPG